MNVSRLTGATWYGPTEKAKHLATSERELGRTLVKHGYRDTNEPDNTEWRYICHEAEVRANQIYYATHPHHS